MFLISPIGTRVELFTNVGGSGDNFTGTKLDDQAALPITSGSGPVHRIVPSGRESLAVFNGENPNGTWTLEIVDALLGNTGTLNSWSLDIGTGAKPTQGPTLSTRFQTDVHDSSTGAGSATNGAYDLTVLVQSGLVRPTAVVQSEATVSIGVDRHSQIRSAVGARSPVRCFPARSSAT